MQTHFKNPLSGRPSTTERKGRDGLPVFRIAPRELTPLRARLADQIGEGLWWVAILWMAYAFVNDPDMAVVNGPDLSVGTVLAAGAFFLAGERVLKWLARIALRGSIELVMTADTIKVRQGLLWKRYDRLLEHRFTLQVHDRAEQERRDYDAKVQRAAHSRVPPFVPYYGDSFHVILAYAGQRVDLASVYGQKQAAAIVARLQLCDRLLFEAIKMSGGISQKPGDDWTDAPGGL